MPPLGKWIQADCPARIDLSGGWSDTPPITYEHGGAVAVVGILINGQVSLTFFYDWLNAIIWLLLLYHVYLVIVRFVRWLQLFHRHSVIYLYA